MELLTKDEVCEILKVSDKTLYRIVAEGRLVRYKIRGSTRFKREDVDRYIASCYVSPPVRSSPPPAKRRKNAAVQPRMEYYPGMKVV